MAAKLGKFCAALGFCVAGASAVLAADYQATSPEAQRLMQASFGNTRICKVEDEFECHVWVQPDGTFIDFMRYKRKLGQAPEGVSGFEAKWFVRIDGGKNYFCRDMGAAQPRCQEEPPHKLGDSWSKLHEEDSAMKGMTEHYSLIAGHH